MNSVTIKCNCGREIGKYYNLIEYLRREKYNIENTPYNRYMEGNQSIEDVFNILELAECCRKEYCGNIRYDQIINT